MNYYQMSVSLKDDSDSEILIALLSDFGFESFEEAPDKLIAYIPEHLFNRDELLSLEYLIKLNESGDLNIEFIPDRNWNEVWESNYPPVEISHNCHIRAPFHEKVLGVRYDIIVKPKMAFGTAHHETTSMMLELVLKNDFTGNYVLDMGCGSGVLAILASMKGATKVTAIDIDTWSYDNTVENAEINEITNIDAKLGGAEIFEKDWNFDVILANINKNILLRDIKLYTNTLKSGGFIYFSGFYNDDLADIENEAGKYGLRFVEKLEKNKWVAAVFVKD